MRVLDVVMYITAITRVVQIHLSQPIRFGNGVVIVKHGRLQVMLLDDATGCKCYYHVLYVRVVKLIGSQDCLSNSLHG